MKVLVDLNVVLDVLLRREPHYGPSASVLTAVVRGTVSGCFPAHGVTTVYYLTERDADTATAERFVDLLLSRFEIVAPDRIVLLRARALDLPDFEDAVTAASAETAGAQAIVTRNGKDFRSSPVRPITPEELLAILSRAAH